MKRSEACARLMSRILRAQAAIEAMKAGNADRQFLGMSPAYRENAFMRIPQHFGVSAAQVNALFAHCEED
jgi:hypothetical protein